MQTTRIHFENGTFIDVKMSDLATDNFKAWLRFANKLDTFVLPADDGRMIKRGEIAWHEKLNVD